MASYRQVVAATSPLLTSSSNPGAPPSCSAALTLPDARHHHAQVAIDASAYAALQNLAAQSGKSLAHVANDALAQLSK